MDAYTRFILSVIALCLVALVLGNLGVLPDRAPEGTAAAVSTGPGAEAAAPSAAAPRFSITPLRAQKQGIYLLRLDQQTGQAWKVPFPISTRGWDPILEKDEIRELVESKAAEKEEGAEAAEADEAGEDR